MVERRLRGDDVRAVLRVLPVSTFTATAEGRIDWVNDRFYEATGIAQDAVLDEAWVGVVHPDDIEQAVWRWTTALESRTPWEAFARVRHADGAYRLWFTRAEHLELADGGSMWIGTTIELSSVPWQTLAADQETT